MATLQTLRKRHYKTIKAFAEAYGCGTQKASGILNGHYHLTLSKDEVKHLASILKISFVECVDACDNTFAELKGYKGDDWKKTARTHKGLWARWQWEEILRRDTRKAADSGDWTEYRMKYASDTFSRSGSRAGEHTWSSGSDNARWSHANATMSVHETCFALLGIPSTATVEQIKQAFRDKAKATHPDSGGSGGNMDALVKAKESALRYADGK